jgi:pilus assembly protein CpaE
MSGHDDLRVMAVVRTPELRDALTGATGINGTRLEIKLGALKEIGTHAIYTEHPDVLLIDLDVDDPDEMGALHRVTEEHQARGTPILATAAKLTPAGMRRLLRDGVTDFLPQPLTQGDLREAIDLATKRVRQTRTPEAGEPKGRVISVLRASGGVGATTVAIHAALGLHKPKRKVTRKVALLDLDLQFGTVGLYLDLAGKASMLEILRAGGRLDGDLVRSAMVEHKSGLKVLTAPGTPVPLDALSGETLGELLEIARQEFDYVVVDLPHALTSWTDGLLARSDLLVMVTELNVPAIRQTKRMLDILNEEGLYTVPTVLALNRYRFTLFGGRLRRRQAEKALGRAFDHYLPNEYDTVVSALNQGVPITEIKRRSKFVRAVRGMVQDGLKRVEAGPVARVAT